MVERGEGDGRSGRKEMSTSIESLYCDLRMGSPQSFKNPRYQGRLPHALRISKRWDQHKVEKQQIWRKNYGRTGDKEAFAGGRSSRHGCCRSVASSRLLCAPPLSEEASLRFSKWAVASHPWLKLLGHVHNTSSFGRGRKKLNSFQTPSTGSRGYEDCQHPSWLIRLPSWI